MYLAKLQQGSHLYFQIRQSYQTDEGNFAHRILFDLGKQPSHYFSIAYDHVIIFKEELLQALHSAIHKDPEPQLEQLLFDFFPRDVQENLLTFKGRTAQYRGRLSDEEREAINKEVHLFDRRRLYYLRYGAVDQSRLTKLHEKCCRPLLGQSRDEREYYFLSEEKVLEPGTYFQYIYAIFNLQKDFKESFAPWLPEALARREVEEQFTTAICRLHRDLSFWQGMTPGNFLHRHLTHYLWMFFDYVPHQPSFQRDFSRAFMGSHRHFKWPERKTPTSPEIIEEIFGVSSTALNTMTKEDLNRLYRKKAMALHPDKGGDAEQFIILTEIYKERLGKK
ncbi:J domain-containing protein [Desulforhopalus sp. 52FAK]